MSLEEDLKKMEAEVKAGEAALKEADGLLSKRIGKPVEEPLPLGMEPLTDTFNARQLVLEHGTDLRYCPKLRGWHIYDGKAWVFDEHNQIVNLAQRTMAGYLQHTNGAVRKHAKACLSIGRLDAMAKLARSVSGVSVRPETFDTNHYLLNCENGTYDLPLERFREAQRSDYLTKVMPVRYDPDAMCPKWEQFLYEVFCGDDNLIDYIRKIMGYCLTGSVQEHTFFILYGDGLNGKSTFINVMSHILGPYAMDTPTQTIVSKKNSGVPNDVARLKGSRMVTCIESAQTSRMDEAIIKKFSSNDKLTARFLHKEYFEFMPTFKVFLTTNHKPSVVGTDRGLWRRMKLIPFDYTVADDKLDKDLEIKLINESSGILNWMISGYHKWQKEGLGGCRAVERATAEYRAEEDVLGVFIKECCRTEGFCKCEAGRLFEAASKFCGFNLTHKMLGSYLTRQGFKKSQERAGPHRGKRFWDGIDLI